MTLKLIPHLNVRVCLILLGMPICLVLQYHRTQWGYCVCMKVNCDVSHRIREKIHDTIYV